MPPRKRKSPMKKKKGGKVSKKLEMPEDVVEVFSSPDDMPPQKTSQKAAPAQKAAPTQKAAKLPPLPSLSSKRFYGKVGDGDDDDKESDEEEEQMQGLEESSEKGGDEGEEEDITPAGPKPKGRKPRDPKDQIPPYSWTEEQERELVEWWRSKPMLYNKRCSDFKKTHLKWDVMAQKAAEFPDCVAKQIKRFTDTMRTTYGRITKQPSGSGAKELTDRDKWLLDNLSFLKDHIDRRPGRSTGFVSIIIEFTFDINVIIVKEMCIFVKT